MLDCLSIPFEIASAKSERRQGQASAECNLIEIFSLASLSCNPKRTDVQIQTQYAYYLNVNNFWRYSDTSCLKKTQINHKYLHLKWGKSSLIESTYLRAF